jgi:NAD(P)H-dependent FMN reductase
MKVALFSGSLRRESLNSKLLLVIEDRLRAAGAEVQVIDLHQHCLTVIDEDQVVDGKVPGAVQAIGQILHDAQAVIVATPEYNGTISAVTKNLIDWTSMLRPHPWTGKHVFIAAATPGPMSALRGLWHSRQPFEVLGAHIFPEMFGLGLADKHLANPRTIADPKTSDRLFALLDRFTAYVQKALA